MYIYIHTYTVYRFCMYGTLDIDSPFCTSSLPNTLLHKGASSGAMIEMRTMNHTSWEEDPGLLQPHDACVLKSCSAHLTTCSRIILVRDDSMFQLFLRFADCAHASPKVAENIL